jgi:hypothetical protein
MIRRAMRTKTGLAATFLCGSSLFVGGMVASLPASGMLALPLAADRPAPRPRGSPDRRAPRSRAAAAQAQARADVVVASASRYVGVFVDSFVSAVAEESYEQDSRDQANRTPQHRESKADFLLVQSGEANGWMAFRDVFEIDRKPVRDRDERLARLFLEPAASANGSLAAGAAAGGAAAKAGAAAAGAAAAGALAKAQAINDESTRNNIGPRRTINNPLLPLAFLQDLYRWRFMYSLTGSAEMDGMHTSILTYEETGRPTIIRSTLNQDLPIHGRYWIDSVTGAVVRAEVLMQDPTLRSRITVTYQANDRFAALVPKQMDEDYTLSNGRRVTAVAKYDHFRRFQVQTDEKPR